MLDRFSKGLRSIINKVTGYALVDKKEVEEIVRDIQRTLLAADVNVRVVLEFSQRLRKSLMEDPPKGMTKREWAIKLIYDMITELLGKDEAEIPLRKKKILLMGLFGSGKTTTAGKLAYYYQKRGLKPFLMTVDIHRPAAYEQLKQISEDNGFMFFGKPGSGIEEILREGLERFKSSGSDVLIVDTAGRSGLDEELKEEIMRIAEMVNPDERILVIPADIGQIAKSQAKSFNESVGIDGVIITKMDATGKAGGAISACYEAGAPVWFIGTGERVSDIEKYSPRRFVSRLLGFGDLEGLLEKAREVVNEDSARKIMEGEFTIEDFISQIKSVSSMGPIDKILDMMGLSGIRIPKDELKKQEEKMRKWQHVINSMTKEERMRPEIMNPSRIRRVAAGSGTSEEVVRDLLRNYEKARKMIRRLKPGRRKSLNIPGFGKIKLG